MPKYFQDIVEQDDQQESLLPEVHAILNKHSLTFSEQGVRLILKAIKRYQSTLPKPTKSQIRKQINTLRNTAIRLSAQLQVLSGYTALEEPPDSLQLRLNHLILCCETQKFQSVSGHEGRPPKSLRLKFLVQMLILIFEEETDQRYVTEEASGWGRERNAYNRLIHKYVEGIIKCVAPDEDIQEALKAARRDPLPLDWIRTMKKIWMTISKKIQTNFDYIPFSLALN